MGVPRVGEIWRDIDPRGGPTVVVEHVCPNGCDQPGKQSAKVRRPHVHVKNWANARPRTMLLTAFYTSTTRSKRGYEFVCGPVEK